MRPVPVRDSRENIRMADVTERTLALLATLQTGRSFGGDELAQRLGVSQRTLRRDVDRLRGYGYPIDTRPGPGGCYRLVAGRAMPPLMLGDDEAIATMLGLAALAATGSAAEGSLDEAATRAYGKVEQYLPKRLRHRAARLRGGLETGALPGPSTGAGELGVLSEAIEGRNPVEFGYETADGAASRRRVEPYRQVHHLMRWYLLGWDAGRRDWRVFRVDRMSRLRASTSVFDPRPLPAATALDYLRQGLRRDRERVVITVEADAAAVADSFRFHDTELRPLEDGRTSVVLWLDSWQWLVTDLAFLGAEFTVQGPESFKSALRAFAARLGDV